MVKGIKGSSPGERKPEAAQPTNGQMEVFSITREMGQISTRRYRIQCSFERGSYLYTALNMSQYDM